MGDAIDIRSGGRLLFKLTPDGKVEFLRDGWLHTVDIDETLRTGKPVVERSFIGKTNVLTKIDMCDKLHRN